jgi:mersacidin/lichenicidin family type 2 lantibiotic
MSTAEVVRAWKDPEYRSTLNHMPPHPAGQIELIDPDLDGNISAKDRGFQLNATHANNCHTLNCTMDTSLACCGYPPTRKCEW